MADQTQTAPNRRRTFRGMSDAAAGWLLSLPLALVLFFFLILPIAMIVVVSFWGATEFSIYPAFQFDNYEFLLTSPVTYSVFLNTVKYAVITWAIPKRLKVTFRINAPTMIKRIMPVVRAV